MGESGGERGRYGGACKAGLPFQLTADGDWDLGGVNAVSRCQRWDGRHVLWVPIQPYPAGIAPQAITVFLSSFSLFPPHCHTCNSYFFAPFKFHELEKIKIKIKK